MTNAEKIAKQLYPESWITVATGRGPRKTDCNAYLRRCAVRVAEHFLKVLNSHDTAIAVRKAVYLSEDESHVDHVARLAATVRAAMLAYELELTNVTSNDLREDGQAGQLIINGINI